MRKHAEGGTSYASTEDPWARGGYSAYAPGQIFEFLDVVSRPEGRSEHTSRLFTSMDGALESGVRAAEQIDEAVKAAYTGSSAFAVA